MNMSTNFRKDRKRWVVNFRYNGKLIREYSPHNSKRSAEEYEVYLRQELAKHGTLDHLKESERAKKEAGITFSAFADRWFKDYVVHNNKHSEQISKDCILKKHLKPYFGKMAVKDISSELIERYKQSKIIVSYCAKTINNQLATLRKCLVIAEEWGVIEHVPKVRLLKTTLPPPRYLTDSEAERLIDMTRNQLIRTMILTALRTGMRHGELIALQWEDVDLKNRRVCIRRCSVKGVVGTTKNGRVRYAPMTQDLIEALRILPRNCDLVFPGVQKNIMHHAITNRWINDAYDSTGIKARGWHVLRHTFASQLVSKGASIKAVQDLLGHATLNMTLRYAHLAPDVLRDTIKLLEPSHEKQPSERFCSPAVHHEINRSPEVLERLLASIPISSPK